MRALRMGLLAPLLLWALAASRGTAAPLPFQGTLSIHYAPSGGPAVVVSIGGAGIAELGSQGGTMSLALPAGALRGAALQQVTQDLAFGVAGGLLLRTILSPAGSSLLLFAATGSLSNAAGLFEFDGSRGTGVMPLNGIGIACTFGDCTTLSEDLEEIGVPTEFPLSRVGAGGRHAEAGLTVIGAPWTLGPASVPGTPSARATGFMHGPLSAASTAFQPGGVVTLVTPIVIDPSDDYLPAPFIATVGVLQIAFVPEPGTAVLLVSGVLLLSIAARRRARSEA
jgi:hypothetical protein